MRRWLLPLIALGGLALAACAGRSDVPLIEGAGQQLDDSIVAALTHPDARECANTRRSYPGSRQPREDAFFRLPALNSQSITAWYVDRIQDLTGEPPEVIDLRALIDAAPLDSAIGIETTVAGTAVSINITVRAGETADASVVLGIGASGNWVASDCA